ncbi:MAG: GNAT family N-acetyltransferase [Bosea sp.]|jgi:putative acetyltransferase|nr:GNAT family N-acetyltransferase [Bosea sp. (in: a-proteobacteria)]
MSLPDAPHASGQAIRPVRDGDGEAVASLIMACFAEYPGCQFSWDEFPELREPARWASARGTRMHVAEDGAGAIIGCICATPALLAPALLAPALLAPHEAGAAPADAAAPMAVGRFTELHKFYVASAHRGRGLAQRLAGLVLDAAREAGSDGVMLWTDSRFTRAHSFYARLGFVRQPPTRRLHDISDTTEHLWLLAPARRP